MDEHLLLTEPRLFGRVERRLAQMERPPFEFCVVHEAQDIGVAELRFLAALGAGRPDALFFPVTSVKGTSRRRSPGEPWGSTSEAAEALLELATGSGPERPVRGATGGDPFAHPDAQRRFRVMSNQEELRRALEYPWEKWTVFLHPAQRQVVERSYRGPARVSGSAGTGKTIVALHRAVHLARTHSDARVLLTTFSTALADALRARVVRLIAKEPRLAERLEVHAMADIGRRPYQAQFGRTNLATPDRVRELLRQAAAEVEDLRFSLRFLWTEWSRVVDAWQLASWEQYRDVPRLGRRTRLPERQREILWSVFSKVAAALDEHGLLDRTAPVRSPGAPAREDGAPAVRVLRGGRGAGHRRGRVTLSGRPRRRVPGRAVFPATSVNGSSRRRSRGGPWG